ncbi:hypothetical protein P3T37_005233 [Kitasatospora sp. MAA4]|nr:hypothetical protein [Kitasatospora sp. MAA4]
MLDNRTDGGRRWIAGLLLSVAAVTVAVGTTASTAAVRTPAATSHVLADLEWDAVPAGH